MRSTLARGIVRHRRTTPKAYTFEYGVYYVHLDLDEIEDVDRRIRLLSHNGRNVLSFRDSDHMAAPGCSLRDTLRAHIAGLGIDPERAQVSLLTNTRIFGYVFNPVSFYFVRDRTTDALLHVIAEVHNTHGEEHVYDLSHEGDDGGGVYRSSAGKRMYVSPFIEMAADYAFECRELADGAYDLRIDEFRLDARGDATPAGAPQPFFEAQLLVKPLPLTNANVAKMLLRYPAMTLRTIALIHWQGLKLWLRGVKYLPHTPRTDEAQP
jgi:DUF1365 family protein